VSLLSKVARKVKKAVTKATYIVPGLGVAAPVGGKRQLAAAKSGLAMGASLASGSLGGGAPVPPSPTSGVPMSLNSGDWGGLLSGVLGGVQSGKGFTQPGGLGSSLITNILPAIIARKTASKAVKSFGGNVLGGVATGLGLDALSDFDGFGGATRRRRINPLNVRAARRAIRSAFFVCRVDPFANQRIAFCMSVVASVIHWL